jgi:uncharacterized membrane protein YdbT with pleckstrin-like domain
MQGYIPTCKQIPPEKRVVIKRTAQFASVSLTLLGTAVLYGISKAGGKLDMYKVFNVMIAFAGLVLFLVTLNFLYNLLRLRSYYYDLGERGIVVSDDVFYSKRKGVSYDMIKDLHLSMDFFDSVLGLCSLHIESSIDRKYDVTILGLSESNAKLLKEMILEKVKEAKKNEARGEV